LILEQRDLSIEKFYDAPGEIELTDEELEKVKSRKIFNIFETSQKDKYLILHYFALLLNGKIHTVFPIFPAFIHTSLVVVYKFLGFHIHLTAPDLSNPFSSLGIDMKYFILERLSATFIAAFSCLFIWKILNLITNFRNSFILLIAYGFGTSHFSISSQAFWQHGLIEFFILAIIYLLKRRLSLEYFSTHCILGLIFPFTAFSRPMSFLLLFPISLYYIYLIFKSKDKKLIKYFSISFIPFNMLSAGILLFINYKTYGHLLGGYGIYHLELEKNFDNIVYSENLWNFCFSPSRGMFIFSPFLLFSYLIFVKNFSKDTIFKISLFSGAFLYILFFPTTLVWHGGDSYGPRMHTESIPLYIILLGYVLNSFRFFNPIIIINFMFILYSLFIYITGIQFYAMNWDACNKVPIPYKFTNWSYPQFGIWFQHNNLRFSKERELEGSYICSIGSYKKKDSPGSVTFVKENFFENLTKSKIAVLSNNFDVALQENFFLPKGEYCYNLYFSGEINKFQYNNNLEIPYSNPPLDASPIKIPIISKKSKQFDMILNFSYGDSLTIDKSVIKKGKCEGNEQ
ncbi:MAG: hypothetical protein KDK36_16675, partial [Leptospiraceae bacterium]|nr:hypothetical protein [Leptospiraceae bacterium]